MTDINRTDKRAFGNVAGLAVWTFAWLASLALANFGPRILWEGQPIVTWIAIGVNVAIGIGWIVAHARYLRGVDDLQRKILLDAIAIALGAGVVGGFAYAAADTAGLVDFDASIALLSALMAVAYMVAIALGNLRYR
jgi:hypothetical protein